MDTIPVHVVSADTLGRLTRALSQALGDLAQRGLMQRADATEAIRELAEGAHRGTFVGILLRRIAEGLENPSGSATDRGVIVEVGPGASVTGRRRAR